MFRKLVPSILLASTILLPIPSMAENAISAQAEPTISNIATRIYGETVSLEEGGYSSSVSLKALYSVGAPFSVYAGAQLEAYEPTVGGIKRASPLAGLEANFQLIRLFAEYRYVAENPATGYSKSDPHFGFTGGYWWESQSLHGWSLISDTYGEMISIPRINWHPTVLAFSKLGLRHKLGRAFYADPYVEAYNSDSSDPAFGRDALEVRTGARLVYWHDQWGAQVSAFRRFVTWVNAPEAKWRLLVSLGGNF